MLFPLWVFECIHAVMVSDMMSRKDGTSVRNGGHDAPNDENRFEPMGLNVMKLPYVYT